MLKGRVNGLMTKKAKPRNIKFLSLMVLNLALKHFLNRIQWTHLPINGKKMQQVGPGTFKESQTTGMKDNIFVNRSGKQATSDEQNYFKLKCKSVPEHCDLNDC